MERRKQAPRSTSQSAKHSTAAERPQRSAPPKQSQDRKAVPQAIPAQIPERTRKLQQPCDEDDTGSTLQSFPPEPDAPRAHSRSGSFNNVKVSTAFDKKAVDLLRQKLDIAHFFQPAGEKLPDSEIVIEETNITPPRRDGRRDGCNLVMSVKIHGQPFANKIIWTRDEQGQNNYEREVDLLKKFRQKPHWHVVFLVCHYISPKNEACLILSPLADCNLKYFLSQQPTRRRQHLVRRWFGCLAAGLEHIHAEKIKHKDIKCLNILVHGENIIITDLGISKMFDDDSETSGPSHGSHIYMAPEVHREENRGRAQDTWAMVCCFIEMFAYRAGFTLPEFRQLVEAKDKPFYSFYHNYTQVVTWLKSVRSSILDQCELALLQFVLVSFELDPTKRPRAKHLVKSIQDVRCEGSQPYIGECCSTSDGVSPEVKLSNEMKAVSYATDRRTLQKEPVLRFAIDAGKIILKVTISKDVKASMEQLLLEVKCGAMKSVRSVERKLLFIIAPKASSSAGDYLSLCQAIVGCVANAYDSKEYDKSSLYDTDQGEEEWPYSTKYFETLDGEIRNRCRTYRWDGFSGAS